MYNPFARKDKKEYKFPSLEGIQAWGSSVANASKPQSQSYVQPQQQSTPQGGMYDQYGKQIGSSATRQTVQVPSQSYARPQARRTDDVVASKQTAPSKPSYITNFSDLAAQKKEQAEAAKGRKEGYYDQAFAERNKMLSEAVPRLQEQFGQTEGYFKKGMARAGESAELKKQNVEQEMGSLQRQAAQTRKESSARTAGRFAGMNTTDSFGFGSHGRAQENIESDFNRFTQENLRKQEQQKFDIDTELQEYEITAQQKIDGLKMQLDNVVSQIQSDMRMNDIEKRNALDSVMTDYEAVLSGIDTEMNGVYERYYTSLAEIGQNSLSEGFMSGGNPENENDFKMLASMDDSAYERMFTQGEKRSSKDKSIQIIDDLMKLNTGGITGKASWAWTDEARKAEGLLKQLSSELQIEEAKRMKGQGTMTDAERDILKDSIAAFNLDDKGRSRLNDADFRDTVRNLRETLGGGTSPGQTVRVIGPTGEEGMIDQSELQEALQNGWRQA